jgi:hypothetical protein
MAILRACLLLTGCISLTATICADTLVLRDGRRVEGELIGVRDGIIDFENIQGGRGTRVQLNRADVVRIEFDFAGRGAPAVQRGGPNTAPGQRPPGLRERDLFVDATKQWNDTGIDVRAGESIYFAASGRVHWGPGREDGPGGEGGSPYNQYRPIPSRPAAGLIARIGETNDFIFIGDEKGPISIRTAGRLYLGINDDNLRDNSGAFRVTVYY